MQVRFLAQAPTGAHALAIPVTPDGAGRQPRIFDEGARQAIAHAMAGSRFAGEAGGIVELFVAGGEGAEARRVLLAGTGPLEGDPAGALERLGGTLAARLLTSGEARLVIDVSDFAAREHAARIAYGAVLRSWRHDAYRTRLQPKQRPSLVEIVVVGAPDEAAQAWERLEKTADGVSFARALVTEPANILYPETFVERCRELEALGVEIEVLDEAAMRELGMGALLGVSQGSVREARVLALKYDGTGGDQAKPIALVGKGVTFDTGGISIKPAAGMEDMKWDMGGAAAVAGAIKALAGRKAKAHVVGVCGLVENMPGGNAQRPGDVVTTMSGQTVEVINTDAEGRLVLCDVISWVQKRFQPETIVDLATLTGAMIISLGNEYGGLFSNDDDLARQLSAAGEASGDKLWRMPLGDSYDKLIESQIADMKNVGPREGGSITAAQFIKRFVDEGVRWAHLDIAGMVWAGKPGPLWDKGATGYGVRLLDRFVADVAEG